jgi:hypothetical protein
MGSMTKRIICVALTGCVFAPHAAQAAPSLPGDAMTWPSALPFLGLLLSIAIGPLLFPAIWHRHYGKIAFAWATCVLVPLFLILTLLPISPILRP